MTTPTNARHSVRFWAPDSTVLSVAGRHAERYLQARLTNDVRLSSPNCAIVVAALTPQGKTEALGRIVKDHSGTFHLVLDGLAVDALSTAIGRFKVAEQIEITPSSSRLLHVVGRPGEKEIEKVTGLSSPGEGDGAASVGASTPDLIALIRRNRSSAAGIDLIAPSTVIDLALEALQRVGGAAVSRQEQIALRLEAKIPSFPDDVNDSVILAEAGLLNAVSFTKGCYAGQEVIAKIDSLGKPPRILSRLSAPGECTVPSGTPVVAKGKTVGKTTSSAYHHELGVTYTFALLKNDGAPSAPELSIDGVLFTVS